MTELGMTFDNFYTNINDPEKRIRFALSPLGTVIGGWGNIFIKLEDVEDLMASQ